jgi:hypothetical protein
MKHFLVVLLLGGGALFFALRTPPVEKLMIPSTGAIAARGGSMFVDIAPEKLPVTPAYLAERGLTTIVYFHDKACANCAIRDRDIDDLLRVRPDVAVRKVSISPDGGAYYKAIRDFQWKVYMSPSVIIFDKDRKMVAADEGVDDEGSELLYEWMAKEAEKAARSKI